MEEFTEVMEPAAAPNCVRNSAQEIWTSKVTAISIHVTVLSERIYDVWSWAELPHDLLFLLMERIVGLTTFIRFGAVCRWWNWLASTSKPCRYKPVPWLMLSAAEGSDVRQFYDLSTNEVYELPLPQAQGRTILGSAHGWLITVGNDGEFHILNPLTGIQIALPPIFTFQSMRESPPYLTPLGVRDNFALKATLSSDLSTRADVIVAVVNRGYDATCLSFCRPSDGGWMNFRRTRQRELDYVGGKLYSITWSGSIFACEISPDQRMVEIAQLPRHIYPLSCYTVECGGELLVIVKRRARRHKMRTSQIDESWFIDDSLPYWTYSIKVYKLNLGDGSLVEIGSIGDYALFVGNNNAICLPATPDIKAYKKNSIYFTDDNDDWMYVPATREGGTDMGVFSLDDGSFRPHCPALSKSTFSLPTWVVPNLN